VDVLRLIDKLEGLASSGTRIPMTSRIVVDEQEFLDLVDQIRVAFPEEVRNARKLSQEREKLLSQAQAEAEKIVSGARDQVASLVSTDEVVILAKQHADEILEQATQEASEIRSDANAYAIEALVRLEAEMQRFAAQIRKARAVVEQRGGGDDSWSEGSPAAPASASNGAARPGDSPSASGQNAQGRVVRRPRE
jgi:cell division septum initiation protein DivIVA